MSYVSIDRTNMRFLHKHDEYSVVADVSYIEAPHVSLVVTPVDHMPFLSMLTDFEARLLYYNTTGQATAFDGSALRSILQELAGRLPNIDADKGKAHLQAEYLGIENKIPHLYVKGADKPALRENIFQPGLSARAHNDEQSLAAKAALQVPNPAPVKSNADSKMPARRVNSGAPVGGIRAAIWAKADQMWALAGKPMGKSEILLLRRGVMDELEKEGVNRNTASVELGNWQKVKMQG